MPEGLPPIEDLFRERALKDAQEFTYYLSPDELLKMSLPLKPGGSQAGSVGVMISGGRKFNNLPALRILQNGQVLYHDGRHRAAEFKRLGYEKIPVRISWATKMVDAPAQLVSETGLYVMDAPWEAGPTDGSPPPRPEYASSTARSPEAPRLTPLGESQIKKHGFASPQDEIRALRAGTHPDYKALDWEEYRSLDEEEKRLRRQKIAENPDWGMEEKPSPLTERIRDTKKKRKEIGKALREAGEAREAEVFARWGRTGEEGIVISLREGEIKETTRHLSEAEYALSKAPPGSVKAREAAAKLATAKEKLSKLIGPIESPRRIAVADPNPYWTRAAEEVERGTHWLDNAAEMYEEGMRSAGHYGDAGLRDAEDFRAKYFKLQDATRRGAPDRELADLYWEFDAEREKLDKHVRRFREMAPHANPAEEIRGIKSELERIIDHANKEEHLIRGTPEAGPHLEPGGSRPDLSRMDRDALLEEISQRRDRALALSDEVAGAGSIIENPASSAHARRVAASDARAMMDRAFRGASKVVKKGTKGALGVAGALGGEILFPEEVEAGTTYESNPFMHPDEQRARAERDEKGAEFLAEQPGYGDTPPWAGQEPRPRDPAAYETPLTLESAEEDFPEQDTEGALRRAAARRAIGE